jgi:hypothetical protein
MLVESHRSDIWSFHNIVSTLIIRFRIASLHHYLLIVDVTTVTMLGETNNSPFDQALSRPFLDEPSRKKWSLAKPASWFAGASTESDDEDDYDSVSFDFDDEGGNEVSPLLSSQSTSSPSSTYGDTISSPFDEIDDQLIMAKNGGSPESLYDLNPGRRSSSNCTFVSTLHHPLELLAEESANDAHNDDLSSRLHDIELGARIMTTSRSHPLEILDADLAILQERQVEFKNIAGSMRQIHDIQQGKLNR